MNKVTVQEFAKTLRNIAYADDLRHKLQWSLRVIHPVTNEGDVGYSGGLFCNPNFTPRNEVSISFSFSESKGIYQFQLWRNKSEIRFDFVGKDGKISLDKLVETAIKEYGIDALYVDKRDR